MRELLVERGTWRASVMIGAGLLLQALTLLWAHPLAFVAFLVMGCPLIMAGIMLYLFSLVSAPSERITRALAVVKG
jgi:hypothetical protein